MSNEGNYTFQLSVRKSSGQIINFDYSRQKSFTFDVNDTKGPTPGAMTIPTGGKIFRLPELAIPGIAVFRNFDTVNYYEYGPYDPDSGKFYPWGEVLPGEEWPFRFCRNILERFYNTGTGTTGRSMYIMVKAVGGDVNGSVEVLGA